MSPNAVDDQPSPPRANVRRWLARWLGRVRILVGNLKTLVPGAEALGELLDLLERAFDPRPQRR